MRCVAVYLVIFISGFSFQLATASPAEEHSHNGRTHSHTLPISGLKHYHKHMHNGRAHIHPFSAEVGFDHTHNASNQSKEDLTAVSHEHAGRTHSHPLPSSGIKHNHQHRHGERSHIHPLPITGFNHFHD